MRSSYLFAKADIYGVLESQKQQVAKGIEELSASQIANTNEDELVNQLVERYQINVPLIKDNEIYVADHSEAKVDVSGDFNRSFDRSGPHYVQGVKVTIAVPFEGDAELFKVQPNTYTSSHPSGEVVGKEVRLIYTQAEPDSEVIKRAYESTVSEIKQYLDWQRPSVQQFNSQLEPLVRELVSKRKTRLAASSEMIQSLGLPVKNRR